MVVTLRPAGGAGSPVPVRLLRWSVVAAVLIAVRSSYALAWPPNGLTFDEFLVQVFDAPLRLLSVAEAPLALLAAALCTIAVCSPRRRRLLAMVSMWLLLLPELISVSAGFVETWRAGYVGRYFPRDTLVSLYALMYLVKSTLVILVAAPMLWHTPARPLRATAETG